jgi:hypothetical protein
MHLLIPFCSQNKKLNSGITELIKLDKTMVPPTTEYHSTEKSSYLPARIGDPSGNATTEYLALISSRTIAVEMY